MKMTDKINKLIEQFKEENRINKKNNNDDIRIKILYSMLECEKELIRERRERIKKYKNGEL